MRVFFSMRHLGSFRMYESAIREMASAAGRCCMKTLRGWGGVARTSRDPPQEPHYRDAVEGPSHV